MGAHATPFPSRLRAQEARRSASSPEGADPGQPQSGRETLVTLARSTCVSHGRSTLSSSFVTDHVVARDIRQATRVPSRIRKAARITGDSKLSPRPLRAPTVMTVRVELPEPALRIVAVSDVKNVSSSTASRFTGTVTESLLVAAGWLLQPHSCRAPQRRTVTRNLERMAQGRAKARRIAGSSASSLGARVGPVRDGPRWSPTDAQRPGTGAIGVLAGGGSRSCPTQALGKRHCRATTPPLESPARPSG